MNVLEGLQLVKLGRGFYGRDTIVVARELLGSYLVHVREGRPEVGRIVEVEAYLGPHDLASHSSRGRTPRTSIMFGPPGYAYVYLIYGMHCCLNVVTQPEGQAAAVLLRAVEPICNISGSTKGPGLLCRSMGIDRRLNGHDLESDQLFIAATPTLETFEIGTSPRIGVKYAGVWADAPLRFFIIGSPFLSRRNP